MEEPQGSGPGGAASVRSELLPGADGGPARLRLRHRPDSSLAASLGGGRLRGPRGRAGGPARRREPAAFLLPAPQPAGRRAAAERRPLARPTAMPVVQPQRGGSSFETTRPRADLLCGWNLTFSSLR